MALSTASGGSSLGPSPYRKPTESQRITLSSGLHRPRLQAAVDPLQVAGGVLAAGRRPGASGGLRCTWPPSWKSTCRSSKSPGVTGGADVVGVGRAGWVVRRRSSAAATPTASSAAISSTTVTTTHPRLRTHPACQVIWVARPAPTAGRRPSTETE